MKLAYYQKQKKLADQPEEVQSMYKELVIDKYKTTYDCDSDEMRVILYEIDEMTITEIERMLRQ